MDTQETGIHQKDFVWRVRFEDVLATVARSLSFQGWGFIGIDKRLGDAFQIALERLGAVGFLAYLPKDKHFLQFYVPRMRISDDLMKGISERFRDYVEEHGTGCGLPQQVDYNSFVLLVVRVPSMAKNPEASKAGDFCCLIYQADSQRGEALEKDLCATLHGLTCLPLLFRVMRHRTHIFAPFPWEISTRYWADATFPQRRAVRLRPPWEPGGGAVRTATLSFDLRKSTLCMELAENDAKFADWLDQLVQLLIHVGHDHGGVFDKFTGDGALIHFLERECDVVYKQNHLVAALSCAVDIQTFMNCHMVKLRKIVRHDSSLFGGAVGIAVAEAHWSVDHAANPIVVGKGVVDACRLGDSTPAGNIRLANNVHQNLPPDVQQCSNFQAFHKQTFSTKEKQDMEAWDLVQLPNGLDLQLNAEKAQSLCNEIYSRSADDKTPIGQ